jgi:hypothetical protein
MWVWATVVVDECRWHRLMELAGVRLAFAAKDESACEVKWEESRAIEALFPFRQLVWLPAPQTWLDLSCLLPMELLAVALPCLLLSSLLLIFFRDCD